MYVYIHIRCIAHGFRPGILTAGDTICRGGLGILEGGRQWRASSVRRRLVSDDDSSTLPSPKSLSLGRLNHVYSLHTRRTVAECRLHVRRI